jgi:hypothetical protein
MKIDLRNITAINALEYPGSPSITYENPNEEGTRYYPY